MNIQRKLIFGASFLVAVSLVISAAIIGYFAIQSSEKALSEAAYEKLEVVTSLSSEEITGYFEDIEHQIQVLSTSPDVINSSELFRDSYVNYRESTDLPSIDTMKASIKDYYDTQYGEKYQAINSTSIDTSRLLNGLDDNSIALQYQYIAANSNPLGGKDALDFAPDDSVYSDVHRTIHPYLREVLNKFGFYDIFIADAKTGHIIYSVYKELDYATSLIDGPYANSGIGEAFRQAVNAADSSDVVLTDFAPYTPSYEAGASFMASPIASNGKPIAVLIFQMPVDKINGKMTHAQNWENMGLGKTGESILIGQDKKPRSQSRILLENKTEFLSLLRANGVDENTLGRIDQMDTNLLLQTIDNPAVNAAIKGNSGRAEYTKYNGEKVFAAYEPISLLGQRWVMLSEIELNEALSSQKELVNSIVFSAVATSIVALLAAIAVVIVFAHKLVQPLKKTTGIMKDLSQGDGDLTARLDATSKDEIGDLSASFNEFIGKIQQLMIKMEDEVGALTSASATVAETSDANGKGADHQQQSIKQIQHSMVELSEKAHTVATTSGLAEKVATEANASANSGSDIMNVTSSAIHNVAEKVEEAMNIIQELESSSESIGSVVGVISGIAEQTNLLALNAAIEAARAGEQGRGFAVVADEVRALASRTQESTLEINSIVEKLQQNSVSAVGIMTSGHESVNQCVEQADKAKQSLDSILLQIKDISEMNIDIASNVEQQTTVSEAVNKNIEQIETISNANSDCAHALMGSSEEVKQSIGSLQSILHNFKLR